MVDLAHSRAQPIAIVGHDGQVACGAQDLLASCLPIFTEIDAARVDAAIPEANNQAGMMRIRVLGAHHPDRHHAARHQERRE